MKLKVLLKDDGYWLSIDGKLKALVSLGQHHGEITTAALQEAAQQSVQLDGVVRCQIAGCMNDGVYSLCAACVSSLRR